MKEKQQQQKENAMVVVVEGNQKKCLIYLSCDGVDSSTFMYFFSRT